ncbi:MAG TPA: metallophosphoesterase [Ruminococcus sp.]|nr:metallophosphoesterase [Ruminococcus sp.]
MQILVVSDSHGYYPCLRDAYLLHRDADLIIHCGDGENDAAELLREFPEAAPRFHIVRGNCDHDSNIPKQITLDLPYTHRITVVHGHEHMFGDFMQNFVWLARSTGADIIAFGHLHVKMDRRADGIKIFNPGSVAKPRDTMSPSYGLIDVMPLGVLTSHGYLHSIGVPADQ